MVNPIKAVLGTVGKAIPAVDAINNVLDAVATTEAERVAAESFKLKIAQEPALAQLQVNAVEAAHGSLFVSGWRPAVGWMCAAALAYSFVLRDLIQWGWLVFGVEGPEPPELHLEQLENLLLAMLGIPVLQNVGEFLKRAKS